jgi:carbonic anhydrase
MGSIDELLDRNRRWAAGVTEAAPDFFLRLSRQQAPDYLWVGCSDSRVPANQIIDLPPGEVFVHRNIANVVAPSDLNFLSVLQYAVEVLRVRRILVCGHYGCGGIRAALDDRDHGLIDNWLNNIRLVHRLYAAEFATLSGEVAIDRLCELNVIEQAKNVTQTTIVRNAFERGQELTIHGIVYGLKDGILRELVEHGSGAAALPRAATVA